MTRNPNLDEKENPPRHRGIAGWHENITLCYEQLHYAMSYYIMLWTITLFHELLQYNSTILKSCTSQEANEILTQYWVYSTGVYHTCALVGLEGLYRLISAGHWVNEGISGPPKQSELRLVWSNRLRFVTFVARYNYGMLRFQKMGGRGLRLATWWLK